MSSRDHFVFVTFPVQGHLNPALQFARRLLDRGADVTFAASISSHTRIKRSHEVPEGVQFATFSDGYDNGSTPNDGGTTDPGDYMNTIKLRGSENLAALLRSSEAEGRRVTCVVYTILLPWAANVARDNNVPYVLLWIQPATVLDIFYHNFSGYGDLIAGLLADEPPKSITLPGLPRISKQDLPKSVFQHHDPYSFVLPAFKDQIEALKQDANPTILVNTFDELETNALKAIDKFKMIPVGPLLPAAVFHPKEVHAETLGDADSAEWLNSKKASSVVYVSFGSLAVLSHQQLEEIAGGLLASGRPFLWVIRPDEKNKSEGDERRNLSCEEELLKLGRIVQWCSQVEVLSHPAVGCFVTHCGWNSTLESLTCGVPMVGFPQWFDQSTNAMLVQEVWRTGLRLAAREDGVVPADEIHRCVQVLMSDSSEGYEIRKSAQRWKELAMEAGREGGTSHKGLEGFFHTLNQQGCSVPLPLLSP